MKKLLIIFLILTLLIIPSCSDGEYKIEESGPYETHVVGNHKYDFDRKGKNIKEIFVTRKKTLTLNGIEYEVYYEHTYKSMYYSDSSRLYKTKDENLSVRYDINTGKVVYVWLRSVKNEIGESTKTEDECKEIAYEFFKQHIPDISNYTIDKQQSSTPQKTCKFKCTRLINGIETTDYATLEISFNGDIVRYDLNCIGALKEKTISDEELEKIDTAILQRMDKIYAEEIEKYNVTHITSKRTVSRLANGKYIMDYEIDTKFKQKENSKETPWDKNDFTHLVIYI